MGKKGQEYAILSWLIRSVIAITLDVFYHKRLHAYHQFQKTLFWLMVKTSCYWLIEGLSR